jgi:hypothetical protein
MLLNFNPELLAKLSDGIILLNRQAQIVSQNQAAEPWVKQCRSMLSVLKNLIPLEVRGRIELPIKLGQWDSQIDKIDRTAVAWLIKNGAFEYAIFIAPEPTQIYPTIQFRLNQIQDIGYVNLLGEEARTQIGLLRMMLSKAESQELDTAGVAVQCTRVETLLKSVSELTQLLGRDEVFSSERLALTDIVRATMALARSSSSANRPDFALETASVELGVVYGHAQWLGYALRVLFDALKNSAPARSQINIGLRQMGNFIVLTGRVAPSLMPLNTNLPTRPTAQSDSTAGLQHRDAKIHMLMCQRIIELHVGQLKLTLLNDSTPHDNSSHGLESFTLTLGTGLPAHERSRASCIDCPHVLQEQAYASDLAQLMHQN